MHNKKIIYVTMGIMVLISVVCCGVKKACERTVRGYIADNISKLEISVDGRASHLEAEKIIISDKRKLWQQFTLQGSIYVRCYVKFCIGNEDIGGVWVGPLELKRDECNELYMNFSAHLWGSRKELCQSLCTVLHNDRNVCDDSFPRFIYEYNRDELNFDVDYLPNDTNVECYGYACLNCLYTAIIGEKQDVIYISINSG